jgi:thiamine-monophosphate kinase
MTAKGLRSNKAKYMTPANDKTLRDVGERFVVAEITRDLQPDSCLLDGFGHDASFVDLPRLPDEVLVINTDRSGMNIAYRMGLAGPECVGDFGVSHAVSDIVVAGGAPCVISVALLLPSDTKLDFVRGVMRGAAQAAQRYGASIVGGDTKQNPKFAMVVTAIGTAHRDQRVRRSGAQLGDRLVVTGHLGAMVLGLVAFDRKIPLSDEARRVVETALVEQRPPFELGRAIGPAGIARAGTDISDGLPGAIHALCSASGVGAVVDERRIPMHPALSSVISATGLSPLQISSAGGDWQYLYAVAPSQIEDLERMAASIGATVSVIGAVVEPGLMAVRTLDGEWRELNRVEHDSFADRDGAGHFSKIGHLVAVAGDLVDQTRCSQNWPLGD